MTCKGSGHITCRCWGDAPAMQPCPQCGGDGPCPGCQNCEQPYVCPGYYAVGEEICAAYCIDAEIEREREEREYEIADWIVETCLTFGASVTTAYRVAALFLEALENEGKVSLG